MTYEEALNEINQECVICRTSNNCAKDECIWFICKKAIDKQIPKKPLTEICGDRCPVCGSWVWGFTDKRDFCGKCSQAIDWSEEE